MKLDKNPGKKKKSSSFYFLAGVVILYFVVFIFKAKEAQEAFVESGSLFVNIIPVLMIVIIFMGMMNYGISPKQVSKYVGEGSGFKGWFFAVLTGILSHGPIYVWYPLLKELRVHGMRNGLIAAFLYNRAIKIPLLPVLIYYFGALFAVVLFIFMIIASLIEGKIIEMIVPKNEVKM